jgi:hypothetical protein
MLRFEELRPRQRRAHLRLLRKLEACTKDYRAYRPAEIWVRGEASFRKAERLHRAGLLTAAPSKGNFFGTGRRPFRELALFLVEEEARKKYRHIMPRSGR